MRLYREAHLKTRFGGTDMFLRPAIITLALLLCLAPGVSAVEPVYLEVVADQSFTPGEELTPFNIRFIVHPNGNRILGMVYPAFLTFTNGNIIGSIEEGTAGDAQVIYSPATQSTFEYITWWASLGQIPTDPDSMFLAMETFHHPWAGSGELFRIHVTPTDTGTITFDTCTPCSMPPYGGSVKPSFFDSNGVNFPLVVFNPTIHVPPQPRNVRFRILTSSGTDTLFLGGVSKIYFTVDANGHDVQSLLWTLQWSFSNGNIIGPISDQTGEVAYSNTAQQAFQTRAFISGSAPGSNPDTSTLILVGFGDSMFHGDEWLWSVTFTPSDTGTIFVDSTADYFPPHSQPVEANDALVGSLPLDFIPGRIVVLPCPYDQMGDVNQDDVLTSADLIYLINYMFKSGPDPLPERSIADVNCSGGLGGSDIIYLVNYVFKGGAAPCACIVRRI
jgi:hypothetical protein